MDTFDDEARSRVTSALSVQVSSAPAQLDCPSQISTSNLWSLVILATKRSMSSFVSKSYLAQGKQACEILSKRRENLETRPLSP